MAMDRIQFQPGLSLPAFLAHFGANNVNLAEHRLFNSSHFVPKHAFATESMVSSDLLDQPSQDRIETFAK